VNPYLNDPVYGKCAGCFGGIYEGDTYLEFWQDIQPLQRKVRQKVHDEFECLATAVGAIEVDDEPKDLFCAGCSLDILPEHGTYLQFKIDGERVSVHKDYACLFAAVDARKFEADRRETGRREVG